MKFLFVTAILFCCKAGAAQQLSKDSVKVCVDKINNYSVTSTSNSFGKEGMDKCAALLYNNAGKYIIDRLIELLGDKNKTLVCHVLLTELLEPGNKKVYHTSEDLTETISFVYHFNNLAWKVLYNKTNLTTVIAVDSAEIKKIQDYWASKKNKQAGLFPVKK